MKPIRSLLIAVIIFCISITISILILDKPLRKTEFTVLNPCIKAGIVVVPNQPCSVKIESYGYPFVSKRVYTELIGTGYQESNRVETEYILGTSIYGAGSTRKVDLITSSINGLFLAIVGLIGYGTYLLLHKAKPFSYLKNK